MEYDSLVTGGAGAATVTAIWVLVRIFGRWAARNRWKTVTCTEPVELLAKRLEDAETRLAATERNAERRIHAAEAEAHTQAAIARSCRAHLDKTLGVKQEQEQ